MLKWGVIWDVKHQIMTIYVCIVFFWRYRVGIAKAFNKQTIQRQMDINKVRTLAVNNSRWIALKYRVCFLSHDAKWMLKEAHFFNSEFWCCLCRILVINGHDWISDWLVLYFFVIIAKFGFFNFLICFDRIDPIDISSQTGQYPIW